jgi:hypothetical protein
MLTLILLLDGSYVLTHARVGHEPTVIAGDLMSVIEYMDELGLSGDEMDAFLNRVPAPVQFLSNCQGAC